MVPPLAVLTLEIILPHMSLHYEATLQFLTSSCKDTKGKTLSLFFPISFFVTKSVMLSLLWPFPVTSQSTTILSYNLTRTHLTALDECTTCPRGYYCRDRGATEPAGMCNAGHICYEGSLDDDPVYNDDASGNNTVVTYGDTCHEGSVGLQFTSKHST